MNLHLSGNFSLSCNCCKVNIFITLHIERAQRSWLEARKEEAEERQNMQIAGIGLASNIFGEMSNLSAVFK